MGQVGEDAGQELSCRSQDLIGQPCRVGLASVGQAAAVAGRPVSALLIRPSPPLSCPPSRLPSSILVCSRAPSRSAPLGQIQPSAARWERQPVTARVLSCAEVRPPWTRVAATLGDLSPRQSLHAQFKGALVAFAGLDDTRLHYHATHGRAVLLLPAGGVERPPALGIRAQARTEHLVADPHHERLERLQRRNRARRRLPDRCHALPVRIEDVNSRVISTANAPRTRRLAARSVQVVSTKLSHSVLPLRRVSPSRHGPSGAGAERIFTDGGADCPRGWFSVRSPSCGPSDNDSPHPPSARVAARASLLPPAPPQASG